MLKLDILINPWLSDPRVCENADYLNRLLNLGQQVASLSHISLNPGSGIVKPLEKEVNQLSTLVHNQGDDMREQYNHLSNIICKLTGDLSTSATKGKIGENFIENVLRENFPDDLVEVTAQTGHEADLHISSNGLPTILIESKMYKSAVSTKEIVKFYNDLESTGVDYGIFVSLTSNICKHRRLEYERKNNKHVIFLPNAGFGGINIIYAILFMREISLKNTELDTVSASIIEEKCKLIYDSLDNLNTIFGHISRLKANVSKSKTVIQDQLNGLTSDILDVEVLTKNIINEIKKSIYTSLADFNDKYEQVEGALLDEIVAELTGSENRLFITTGQSLNVCKQFELEIYREEVKNKYSLMKRGEIICELRIGKTKATYDFIKFGIKYDIRPDADLDVFGRLLGSVL